MPGRVVILMGSKSDLDQANKITAALSPFGIPSTLRVASAHKSVRHLLAILEEEEDGNEPLVYVTVAGRSNALSGMVDANSVWPVIACPPVSTAFGGADLYSSLRMPGGVAPLVVLEPEGAALAAAKMLALTDAELRLRIMAYHDKLIEDLVEADKGVRADKDAR